MTSQIAWTAREALACAYCWAEFSHPEKTCPDKTPESYWLGITEHARNDCRRVANERMLLAVARGQAVAIPPVEALRQDQFATVKSALGLKADYRVWQILRAVLSALKPRCEWSGRDGAA